MIVYLMAHYIPQEGICVRPITYHPNISEVPVIYVAIRDDKNALFRFRNHVNRTGLHCYEEVGDIPPLIEDLSDTLFKGIPDLHHVVQYSKETIMPVFHSIKDYLAYNGRYPELANGDRGIMYCCPFHEDHSPSMHVTVDDLGGKWHCFGCGMGGTFPYLIFLLEGFEERDWPKAYQMSGRDPLHPEASHYLSKATTAQEEQAAQYCKRSSKGYHVPSYRLVA